MKYPKEYLDEIKLRLKVSQVVGKTVQLKKRGKEFIGLSPFKNEKTPSFTVNDEKEFYHCFSTGEHGNIFDFIMKTQNLKFGEAVKNLANLDGKKLFSKDFSNFTEGDIAVQVEEFAERWSSEIESLGIYPDATEGVRAVSLKLRYSASGHKDLIKSFKALVQSLGGSLLN